MAPVQVWDVPHIERPHGAPRYGGHSSTQATPAATDPVEPSVMQPPVIKRGTRGIPRQPQVTCRQQLGRRLLCGVTDVRCSA